IVKETKHLYIDLPAMSEKLNAWMDKASLEGRWSDNAINMTKAWIRDGLQERAITRDLKWGIPVPKAGYENKVFYVWFNAPIGYLSITKQLADELIKAGKESFDWKSWWLPSESEEGKKKPKVDLFQFIGKDNIPFHTVVFPCTMLGSPHEWTKLHHMSSTEFLNYEDGKFSKSLGVGVFGSDAIDSGIPADAWRFYIFYNRPEKQDYQFTWKDFMEKLNGELIGNLGNLVNRTLLFVTKYYDGKIPDSPVDQELWTKVRELEAKATESLEWADLKDAFHTMFEISDICNKKFQASEPWKARTENPAVAESLIHNLCYVIKDLMIMMNPYMPQYTQKIMSYFGKSIQETRVGQEAINGYTWADLGVTEGLNTVGPTEVYFKPMDQKTMLAFREKFAGKQNKANKDKKDKKDKKKNEAVILPIEKQADFFNTNIELTVAKIVDVKPNPEGEKLYIETLDDGSGSPRTIQSGLRMFLKEEDLLGKNVIIASNLAARTMRGVESRGMLLAGHYKDADGKECVEVLEAPWALPGTKVILEGADASASKKAEITGDEFFSVQIAAKEGSVQIAGKKLLADGKELTTKNAVNSDIA
ncbi:MAG: class I tRNA ligase family protein, partial [Treponema sp.]|nr:class I tRNA ligase family protein [Treponema sp.]